VGIPGKEVGRWVGQRKEVGKTVPSKLARAADVFDRLEKRSPPARRRSAGSRGLEEPPRNLVRQGDRGPPQEEAMKERGFEAEGGERKPYFVVEDARVPEAGIRGGLAAGVTLLRGTEPREVPGGVVSTRRADRGTRSARVWLESGSKSRFVRRRLARGWRGRFCGGHLTHPFIPVSLMAGSALVGWILDSCQPFATSETSRSRVNGKERDVAASRSDEQLAHLSELAGRLGQLSPVEASQLSLVALGLGAIYSLREAIRGGYRDNQDPKVAAAYREYLQAQARAIASPDSDDSTLDIAEYFFNSALLRIAVLNERINRQSGNMRDVARPVRREVNRLKHAIAGVDSGRTVTLEDAVRCLTDLVEITEAACGRSDAPSAGPLKPSEKRNGRAAD
jgi:hypothetical protein